MVTKQCNGVIITEGFNDKGRLVKSSRSCEAFFDTDDREEEFCEVCRPNEGVQDSTNPTSRIRVSDTTDNGVSR